MLSGIQMYLLYLPQQVSEKHKQSDLHKESTLQKKSLEGFFWKIFLVGSIVEEWDRNV